MITNKPFLQTLDLSWCHIGPKMMAKIAKSLRSQPDVLRNLNISYNSLNFNDEKYVLFYKEYLPDENVLASFKFFASFCQYLSKAKDLIHLDICGLNFKKQQYDELLPLIE
jgi:hypothetical protein